MKVKFIILKFCKRTQCTLVIGSDKFDVKSKVASSAFVTLQPVSCLAVFQFSFNLLVKILGAINCVPENVVISKVSLKTLS